MPKAKVLPVPVCAIPIMSLPSMPAGIDWCWIGVGTVNFCSSKISRILGETPRLAKPLCACVDCVICIGDSISSAHESALRKDDVDQVRVCYRALQG